MHEIKPNNNTLFSLSSSKPKNQMRTAEEGGATVTTNSSYGGGGGAGGKFRKKPFPRPTTPYDRAPTPFRRNDNSGSWLTKLVVDPASKLIYYGAHRLFAPLFRKRLPPPPPPQAPGILLSFDEFVPFSFTLLYGLVLVVSFNVVTEL